MDIEIAVYENAPIDFLPQVEIAGCYIEIDKKLLILQRFKQKAEGGKWGIPAGKLEPLETPEIAARRELYEETGILIENSTQIQSLGALYMRKPEIDYIYHMFKVDLLEIPTIVLSNEHESYKWASHQDLEEMPLMAGAKQALEQYRYWINTKCYKT